MFIKLRDSLILGYKLTMLQFILKCSIFPLLSLCVRIRRINCFYGKKTKSSLTGRRFAPGMGEQSRADGANEVDRPKDS